MRRSIAVKSTMLPNIMVIGATIGLMAIGVLAGTIYEGATLWGALLFVLPMALFFVPDTEAGKCVLVCLGKAFPFLTLALFLMIPYEDINWLRSGLSIPLFGIAIAFLTFEGKGKGVLWVFGEILFAFLFVVTLYHRSNSCYIAFTHAIVALIVLTAGSVTKWIDEDLRWIPTGIVMTIPAGISLPLSATPYSEYIADLFVSPFPVVFLDGGYPYPDYICEHLRRMAFLGSTPLPDPQRFSTRFALTYESRILVILGHRIGWAVFVLVGLLLAVLTVGLVLSSMRRRKGLGNLFPYAAIGAIVFPILLLFLTNLGILDAKTVTVPLLTRNFTTNLASVILLRLSIAYKPDPECYVTPSKSSLLDTEDDEDSESGGPIATEGVGKLHVFTIPENKYIDVILKAFGGQIVVPFQHDLRDSLQDRALLYSTYSGDLADVLSIFSQLKLLGDTHFIKVSVSEESIISRLMLAVERVTEALSNQQKVDYSVGIDEDVPQDSISIQIVSTKENDT